MTKDEQVPLRGALNPYRDGLKVEMECQRRPFCEARKRRALLGHVRVLAVRAQHPAILRWADLEPLHERACERLRGCEPRFQCDVQHRVRTDFEPVDRSLKPQPAQVRFQVLTHDRTEYAVKVMRRKPSDRRDLGEGHRLLETLLYPVKRPAHTLQMPLSGEWKDG